MDSKFRETEKVYIFVGYILAYFVFTTIVFFVFGKGRPYIHIMGITSIIFLLGKVLKWYLK
jgi:hypothetical protein